MNDGKCFHTFLREEERNMCAEKSPRRLMLAVLGSCTWLVAGTVGGAPLSPGTVVVGESVQSSGSPNDSLIAVDPATGATTTISDNAVGSGPSFNFGTAGAFINYISQQSDGSLLVLDVSENVGKNLGSGRMNCASIASIHPRATAH